MVERQEVEALLAAVDCDDPWWFTKTEMVVITALCRAWLEVQDAPTVAVTDCNQIAGASDLDHGDMAAAVAGLTPGQRVRIVPVEGDQ